MKSGHCDFDNERIAGFLLKKFQKLVIFLLKMIETMKFV